MEPVNLKQGDDILVIGVRIVRKPTRTNDKNYIKYFLIGMTVCLCHFTSLGQQKVDSLLNVLKTAKADSNKVNTLNALAMEFRSNNPDTAFYLAQQALTISEKINFRKGIAEAYLWMGTSITNLGKNEEALSYLSKALAKSF